ncbi:hypothetical protein GCM10023083_34980 [Streptomyces phyllanthi]
MTDDQLSLLTHRIEQSFGHTINEMRQEVSTASHPGDVRDLIVHWYDHVAHATEVVKHHRAAHLAHVAADDAAGIRTTADALAGAIRSRDARAQTLTYLIKRHASAPHAPDFEPARRAAEAASRSTFPVLRPLPEHATPPRAALSPTRGRSR